MPISRADFEVVRSFVREQAAIALEPGKEYLVESRLSPIVEQEGMPSLRALIQALTRNPSAALRTKVVDAIATHETSFFRDGQPFDILRKEAIPAALAAHAADRKLSLWCGASSTGQEPYSAAIVLQEHFPQLCSWSVSFLATDISGAVIEKARAGRFAQADVDRGMPADYLTKHFEKQGSCWVVKDAVRRSIRFEELNLIRPWPNMGLLDIVFLRNVLIYFDVDAKKNVLSRVADRMRPGGFLFLGGAETTLHLEDRFERMPFERASCYRVRG